MIKRYDIDGPNFQNDIEGDWVKYENYKKLEQKYITNRLKNIVIKIGPMEKNETGIFVKVPDKLKDIVEYFKQIGEVK